MTHFARAIWAGACLIGLACGAMAQDLVYDRWSYHQPGDLLHDAGVHTAGVILPDLSFAIMVLDADGSGTALGAMLPGDDFEDEVKSILTMTDGSTRTLTVSGDKLRREEAQSDGMLTYTFFIAEDDIELFKAAQTWTLKTDSAEVVYPLAGSRRAIEAAQAAQALSSAGASTRRTWADACDAAAGHPFDAQAAAPGIGWDDIDPEVAVKACHNAYVSGAASPRITYQLGRAHDRAGDARAVELLTQAAIAGKYPIAYAHLGSLYLKEDTYIEQDIAVAGRLLAQGAELGGAVSEFAYGHYLIRHDAEDRFDEAVALLTKAADAGYPPALRMLGEGLLDGTLGDVDAPRAAQLLGKAAEAGDAAAAFSLAQLYLGSDGVPADPRKYLSYLKLAARGGDADALAALALE